MDEEPVLQGVVGDQVEGWYSVDERSAGVHKGEDERALAEAERGPEGAYHEAKEAAEREDVGEKKPADEAQAEDEEAESAGADSGAEAEG